MGAATTLNRTPQLPGVPGTRSPIQIIGEAVVGGTLLVAAPEWSDVHQSGGLTVDTCKIQWLRGHKDKSGRYSFSKIIGAKTPRYLITKQDMNCRYVPSVFTRLWLLAHYSNSLLHY